MNEKTAALEAKMLLEVKEAITKKRFELDLVDATIRKNIASILGYNDFAIDAWLISPCSYLDASAPLDVLKFNSSKVVEAAVRKSNWINPG